MSPKKTSFPKQDIRVLLLPGVGPTAVEVFSPHGYSPIEAPTQELPADETTPPPPRPPTHDLRSPTKPSHEVQPEPPPQT